MNRNQILILFGFFLIGIILYQISNKQCSLPSKSIKQPFNQQPKQSQPERTIMFFYAPWCHHCKNFKSTWEDIENKYKNTNVKTISINCDEPENAEIMKKYNVDSFPTIFVNEQVYNGNRDYESLVKIIESDS